MANVGVDRIGKQYGAICALRDVSLAIEDGEFLTLLGPSGCGKSTLLRIIAGLESQSQGQVMIAGQPVDRLRPSQRDVAMVFQSYALYPYMSAGDNIATPLRMRQLGRLQRLPLLGRLMPGSRKARSAIDAAVKDVAAALDIEHLLHRKPGQLSGGQRQRVAVGRALVRRPHVFLMDEPLSNLDAKLRVQMRAEIKDLHRRLGITFIYVTHDQAEAMTMSDRVAVMMQGEILQVARPRAIYAAPADTRVAAFIGSPQINLLKASVRLDGALEAAGVTIDGGRHGHSDSRCTVGLRPEALSVVPAGTPGCITGTVRMLEHLGAELFIYLAIDGHTEPLAVRTDPSQHEMLDVGDHLSVLPRTDAVLLFDGNGRLVQSAAAEGRTIALPKGSAQHYDLRKPSPMGRVVSPIAQGASDV